MKKKVAIKKSKFTDKEQAFVDILLYTGLRRSEATMFFYGSVDIKEAQRLLGHSSIKVTLEIYTHLI